MNDQAKYKQKRYKPSLAAASGAKIHSSCILGDVPNTKKSIAELDSNSSRTT